MGLINNYSMSLAIRCKAINLVSSNSGKTPGLDNRILISDQDKLKILSDSKEFKQRKNYKDMMSVKLVEIPRSDGKVRTLGISNILDRVLQTQLYILLDPYYEAKYPEDLYSFRNGRNTLQAVGRVKSILERSDLRRSGLVLLDIEKCFDRIPHSVIIEQFEVPPK